MRPILVAAALSAAPFPTVSASAASAGPPPATPASVAAPVASVASVAAMPRLRLDTRRATLPNGLRVVLSVDHTSPTIAVDVMYDVGSRNEQNGHSGFAHLFEHMMFQGSGNVARGEHMALVTSHGGTLNANTSADRTNYFDLLPESELPLALWLEADRMKSLDVSQSNLDNQRQVVEEEFRMRILNAPYVPAELRLEELVFQGYWPYEHPTIGSMKDLDAATLEWVRAFHSAYYAPNEAVVAISGDFDPDVAMDRVRAYFGDAKANPNLPPYDPGPMSEQTAPRQDVVTDSHARFPAVSYGWAIPPSRTPDHYALEIAASILADGDASRLHSELVHDTAIAIDVDADTEDHRGPDLFEIEAKVSGKGTVAEVDKAIGAAVATLAKAPPTSTEMDKVRRRIASHFVTGLESNHARAERLAEFELYWGDAALLNDELDRYLAVTSEDVSKAVAKYLTAARRSRVEVKPTVETEPANASKTKGAKS
jgi:zinc protease